MDELFKAGLTVLVGVVVYVCGKLVERAWLEPVLEVRRVIGEIAFAVTYYANKSALGAPVFHQEGMEEAAKFILDEALEGMKVLREKGSLLQARAYMVPRYGLAVRLGMLPPRQQIDRAVTGLIGYSNTIATGDPESSKLIREYQREIEGALNLIRRPPSAGWRYRLGSGAWRRWSWPWRRSSP